MPDSYFDLGHDDKSDLLQVAGQKLGRPPHLLEKDIWVVAVLSVMFGSGTGAHTTFKGGTSLSKAYRVIERFSEDIDLTVDIRHLVVDEESPEEFEGMSRKRAKKLKERIETELLPELLGSRVVPHLEAKLPAETTVSLQSEKPSNIVVSYPSVLTRSGRTDAPPYISAEVLMEFGGLSTAEPRYEAAISCDIAQFEAADVAFPAASVYVMGIERTFWEKVTAVHSFCKRGRVRSAQRLSRHWYDIARIAASQHADACIKDRTTAALVANFKTVFYPGGGVSYEDTVTGRLQLSPEGVLRNALETDYSRMVQDGMFEGEAMTFEQLIRDCADIAERLNRMFG